MRHWTNAHGTMALLAAPLALAGWGVVSEMALWIFWLFAGLAACALVTGAFGRGRNGLYCSERALTLSAAVVGIVALGSVWVAQGWTAERAGRVLDQQVAALVQRTAGF
jgi:hypothetical protein